MGVAVQFLLPVVLSTFLPLDVSITAEPLLILEGIAIGGWIALLDKGDRFLERVQGKIPYWERLPFSPSLT